MVVDLFFVDVDVFDVFVDFVDLELVIVLGGDGIILCVVELVCDGGVFVFGINMGYVGFFVEIDCDDMDDVVCCVIVWDYEVEE